MATSHHLNHCWLIINTCQNSLASFTCIKPSGNVICSALQIWIWNYWHEARLIDISKLPSRNQCWRRASKNLRDMLATSPGFSCNIWYRSITSISNAQLFWNFAQSTAEILLCSVQNFKMTGQLKNKIWTNEVRVKMCFGERERARLSLSAFLRTEDIGVHISRLIITYTLE